MSLASGDGGWLLAPLEPLGKLALPMFLFEAPFVLLAGALGHSPAVGAVALLVFSSAIVVLISIINPAMHAAKWKLKRKKNQHEAQ